MLTGWRLQHWRRGSKNGKLFFDGFSFCIMAEASQYRPIPELDLSGPAHVVAERWRRWKRSFDLYIAGQDIDDATRKHSLLLHYAGMNVQDLFETLTEPAQPEDRYAKTIAMLDGQFKVAKNTPFERHVFRQMCPEANEPIDKFVARLRQQARLCEYSDLDDQLRDQLLDKIAQPGLRRKLLEKEDMTLDDALKICRSWEATAHQTAQMSSSATSSATTTTVHAVAHSSQQQRRKWNQPRTPPHREEPECPNCGYGEHKAGQSCPAKGQTCLKCGKRNHFSRKCQSGRSTGRTNSTRSQPWRRHQPRPGRAHHVTDRDDTRTDSNDFETVFTVGQTVTTPTPRVTIRISEAETTAIVDSGASCNLLGTDQLASLRRLGLQTTLVPCRQALYAYGSTQPLKLAGQFTVPTSINGKTIPTTFVVIDGPGDILLGKASSELFGATHFDTTLHTNSVTNEDQAFRLSLQQHFPAVFEGVGKLRGHQATIHIDPTVTPVAQRPRRVPFALRPKVRDHLKDLMEKDIIEKVDGPSPWVSPVVVTPKPNGDIRLCVDMRRANEAIIRERHPIPTIDEVLEQLNESTVFSKIDLRWGFHQVELSEDSRSITTFALDENLYRYKRMMFSITSAPEQYQNIIAQVIKGCEGALNIADDLIVYGRNETEHDDNLFRVLRRLEEKGLTVGLPKCSFRQPQIEFFGLRLSDRGVEPTTSKVKAITDAPRPSNASEIRSFLGTVGFSSRFIPGLSTTAEPLRRLTHKGARFVWGREQQDAFDTLKRKLAEVTTLAYFNRDAQCTQVIADASPVGLGAVIVQQHDGITKPICYASRTLTDVERRYSQTEKEALALVWACERFHQYIYGLRFELVTDHKPLEIIYSRTSKPSARIERWVLRLQPYDFKVRYTPGTTNIADALSRMPVDSADDEFTTLLTEESVRFVTNQPSAVRDNDSARKQAAKDRSDSRFNAKERDLEPGDKVLVRNDQPTNKLSTPFLPTPCKTLDRHVDQLVIEKADHSIIRRNLHHAKRFLEEEKEEKTDEDEAKDQDAAETADEATAEDAAQTADEVKDQDAAETVETAVTPTPSTCRPKRNTAPPACFKDFVTSFR